MNMPLMIDLTNVVIVGGGVVASRRAQTLSQYVEHMTVISPTITEKLQNMVDKGVVIWKEKVEPSDIVDAYLVIAATNEPCVNEAVKQALPEHTLFNNVGDASNGNVVPFQVHYTATSLTISVSTNGAKS